MARGAGEGSIYKRKDGRWCGVVTIGTDPQTGKQKRKYFYGKERKEVAKKITNLKKKLFDGTYLEPCNMLLTDWLNRWVEGRKNSVSQNTYKFYKTHIRLHIAPEIGNIKLKDLKPFQIQSLLNDKFEDGRTDGEGGLSATTVGHIYRTLHAGLGQATIEDLIPKNPCKGVDLPKNEDNFEDEELHTWNKEQVNIFLEEARNFKYYILHYLALNTGMRQGELLGLQWKDIDFKNKQLNVKRQYDRSFKFKKLKSKNARRIIPLPEQVIKKLKRHKIIQGEKKLALGEAFNDNDLVCCNKIGKPISHRQIYKDFKDIIKETGLPEITFHDTRHTFATTYLEAGGNIKTLQQILGHSSISTTLDIYGSVSKEMLNEASRKMEMMYKTIK